MLKINANVIFFYLLFPFSTSTPRTVYRSPRHDEPRIVVWQSDAPEKKYTLTDSHLRYFPLFGAYNEKYFQSRLLPKGTLPHRNTQAHPITGAMLSSLIETFAQQVATGNLIHDEFTILKKTDFNRKRKTGLVIAKFVNYPFVIKLFIDTAYQFVRPYSKGLCSMGMFLMGGSTRHLTGLTRIKNRDNLEKQVTQTPELRDKVYFPQKWFWLPKKPVWLHITGYNIGTVGEQTEGKIPAIFGIVAEEIIPDKTVKIPTKTCLRICRRYDFVADPNLSNFHTDQATKKIALIDTEHFPTLMGAQQQIYPYRSYVGWYSHVTRKFVTEKFLSSRRGRQLRQTKQSFYQLYPS